MHPNSLYVLYVNRIHWSLTDQYLMSFPYLWQNLGWERSISIYLILKRPCYLQYFSKPVATFLVLPGRRVTKHQPHDGGIQWKHFARYWPFVQGIQRSPVDSPHKGQWRGGSIFSMICAWTNGWVNIPDAGDLRPYRAHYGVTIIQSHGSL